MGQPIMEWSNSYNYTCRYPGLSKGNAGSILHLAVAVRLVKARAEDKITIHVNLEDSEISPAEAGVLEHNENHKRGYYQDRITVQMSLENHPELTLISDGPATQMGSGSTQSSVMVDSGVSGNIGFFGEVITGNVSAHTTKGNTYSFSKNLTDFAVKNKSDFVKEEAIHDYRMKATKLGHPYSHMSDLLIDETTGLLENPPELATGNFPIISQAIWQARNTDPIDETVLLLIHVRQHLALVEVEGQSAVNDPSAAIRHSRRVFHGRSSVVGRDWSAQTHGWIINYRHVEKLPLHKLEPEQRESM